jgi:hypothetical protein
MQKLPLKVMIIGAGTGGLALAHGFKQAGVEVIVFERDRTPRDARGGYRVGISPGGSQALKTCLPPELFGLFLATSARPPRYFNMLTEEFSNLISLEMGESDSAHSEQNVNRLTLRRVLLTGLEDVVRFDKKFVRYEEDTDGSVTVFFEDGSQCRGDVLTATTTDVYMQEIPASVQSTINSINSELRKSDAKTRKKSKEPAPAGTVVSGRRKPSTRVTQNDTKSLRGGSERLPAYA